MKADFTESTLVLIEEKRMTGKSSLNASETRSVEIHKHLG